VGLLDDWKLTYEEVNELLAATPSLRGMVFGNVAEFKLRKNWFENDERVSALKKYDDHDRKKKGDLSFFYKGFEMKLESKSLQSNATKRLPDGTWFAKFQCDASDKRLVTLPNGSTVATTCLVVGEFDLLAVNLFGFHRDWVFGFAKNEDLPRTKRKIYSEYEQQHLLTSLMPITWPLQEPYHDEPWSLLDELVEEKRRGKAPELPSKPIPLKKTENPPSLLD
jgi:hypothetical protein